MENYMIIRMVLKCGNQIFVTNFLNSNHYHDDTIVKYKKVWLRLERVRVDNTEYTSSLNTGNEN